MKILATSEGGAMQAKGSANERGEHYGVARIPNVCPIYREQSFMRDCAGNIYSLESGQAEGADMTNVLDVHLERASLPTLQLNSRSATLHVMQIWTIT